jgi:broad specificity phosphatase PhoE
VANKSGVLQGQMDSPLNQAGQEQANALGRALLVRCKGPVPVYSSDLSRAVDTATAVLSCMGVPTAALKTDERLRERALGPFQGLTATQCERDHPLAWNAFVRGHPQAQLDTVGAAGVEDNATLQHRTVCALREIASVHAGGVVIVVSHGGAIHSAVAGVTGNEALPHIGNGAIVPLQLSPDGTGRLGAAPDASHIVGEVRGADDAANTRSHGRHE